MSKYQFKNFVDGSVNKKALEELNEKALNHSKSRQLIKSKLVPEQYIMSELFSLKEKELCFKLRTRTINCKKNFPGIYKDNLYCRFCNSSTEIKSQQHLLLCEKLSNQVENTHSVIYDDLFAADLDRQHKAVRHFTKIHRMMEILLNTEQSSSSSPSEDGP